MVRRRKKDKSQRNVKIFMSLFLAVIMVSSILAVFNGGGHSGVDAYNGYRFDVDVERNVYTLEIDDTELFFYNHPSFVDTIKVDPGVNAKVSSAQALVYLFDPESPSISYIEQTRFDFARLLPKNYVAAVTTPSDDYNALPTYSCDDALGYIPIMLFNQSNETSVNIQGDCIIVNGQNIDFLRIRDRILYEYYGVIQNGN